MWHLIGTLARPGCCDHKKRRNKAMTSHKTGTLEEWAAAREELLAREKEHTRLGDELARQRRDLPWVRVEKDYHFDTDDGTRTLAELFDGRSQLLIYHFMFGPSYAAGCPTCSSIADSVNGVLPHLNARDVTVLFVSQAPLETLQAFKRRMGWSFPWVSSANSEFNIDLGFSSSQEQTREWAEAMLEQLPPIAARNARETGTDVVGYLTESFGFSVFVLDDWAVYQTYSAGARGVEFLMGYYAILDRAAKGRDEDDGFQLWIRRHDEYDSQ
jgi:predicted dithiol-disulfide oxidoreductase (DUF899 family)